MFLLSLAAFASAASLRATDPLLPLLADEFGVTAGAASASVTAFALSYGLLQVVCGPLGDRYGRYRTIAAAALVSAAGSAACAAAPSLEALIAARFVSGATIGAFVPLALAWIGDTVPHEKRQPLLARFLVGQMAGLAFGTAAAGWLGEQFGWRAIFMALAALLLLIALLLLAELRNPLVGGGGGGSIRESSGFYMFHTTVPIHVTQVGPDERGSAVALFATFLFLGQACGVWLAALVVDAAGMAPVFVAAAVGLAALAAGFRYFLSSGGT